VDSTEFLEATRVEVPEKIVKKPTAMAQMAEVAKEVEARG
jgi:hypothetical protein